MKEDGTSGTVPASRRENAANEGNEESVVLTSNRVSAVEKEGVGKPQSNDISRQIIQRRSQRY
jgi:hypothetical protein